MTSDMLGLRYCEVCGERYGWVAGSWNAMQCNCPAIVSEILRTDGGSVLVALMASESRSYRASVGAMEQQRNKKETVDAE